jgi:hypothetical protein
MPDEPDLTEILPPYVPAPRSRVRRRRGPSRITVAIVAVLLGAAGGTAVTIAVRPDKATVRATGSPLSTPRSTPSVAASVAGQPAQIAGSSVPAGSTGARPATHGSSSTTTTAQFGAGTYVVGHDILAGTYRSAQGDASCAWANLRADNTIALGHGEGGPITVTVLGSDKALELQGPCRYSKVG